MMLQFSPYFSRFFIGLKNFLKKVVDTKYRNVDTVISFSTLLVGRMTKIMMFKGQNKIAKGCAAQSWRKRQQNVRSFFGRNLRPSVQPSHTNNLFINPNTICGNRTVETLASDYRSIHWSSGSGFPLPKSRKNRIHKSDFLGAGSFRAMSSEKGLLLFHCLKTPTSHTAWLCCLTI